MKKIMKIGLKSKLSDAQAISLQALLFIGLLIIMGLMLPA